MQIAVDRDELLARSSFARVRSVSGHLLTEEAEVARERQWFRKTLSASLTVEGQRVAEIESRFVPTELAQEKACRSTKVTFLEAARWSIVTGAPDEPPEAMKRFGVTYGTRHPVASRVARVTDDRDGRFLAEAVWPDPKLQKQMMVESMSEHGPNLLERMVGPVARLAAAAPQITVADTTLWLLPVEIPGRFNYGTRLGEMLTILSSGRTTQLIPNEPVPLEAALLCWHIEIGDVEPESGGGG